MLACLGEGVKVQGTGFRNNLSEAQPGRSLVVEAVVLNQLGVGAVPIGCKREASLCNTSIGGTGGRAERAECKSSYILAFAAEGRLPPGSFWRGYLAAIDGPVQFDRFHGVSWYDWRN